MIVAAALVSTSLLVAPLETTKTSTSTATSVVTTTLPQVTQTNTLILPPVTETSTTTSTTITTVTVTIATQPPSPCGDAASPQAPNHASDPAPITIGTSTDGSATNSSSERKALIAAGRIWVFYTDGCNIVYASSADGGNTWSMPEVAKAGIERGWFFTVGQNGSTLYFVVSASDGTTNGMIVYREGTMESNGTVSWSMPEEDVPFGVGSGTVPTVALDTTGNVWVAIETYTGGGSPSGQYSDRSIEVFKGTNGSWSEVFDMSGLADYPRPILLPLASGKMALEILTETPGEREVSVYTTADGGSTWSSAVTFPQGPDNILTLSSVSVGNTVYSVTSDPSGNIDVWTFAYDSSTFSGPTTLAKCCLGYNDAVISTDGTSSLFVAYSNLTSVVYETSADLGASWSPPTTITTTESEIQPGSLATSYLASGQVPVVWTAQDVSGSLPFNVRFAPATY